MHVIEDDIHKIEKGVIQLNVSPFRIPIAIGVFGIASGQVLTGVVGPLVKVPVLITLVNVAGWLKRNYYHSAKQP